MTRTICSILAAGAAAISMAAPAHAASRYGNSNQAPAYRAVSFEHREYGRRPYRGASFFEWRREREWAQLERARRMFYRHWNGNPYERVRFQRWYAHRCEELRRY
jgi:hypothetical protein